MIDNKEQKNNEETGRQETVEQKAVQRGKTQKGKTQKKKREGNGPLQWALVFYLIILGIGPSFYVINNFPEVKPENEIVFPYSIAVEAESNSGASITNPEPNSPELKAGNTEQKNEEVITRIRFRPFITVGSEVNALLLLAFFSGMAGSFIPAGQSLSSYMGNTRYVGSWFAWYFLRPWIGGVLGLTLFFTLHVGFIAGTSSINPFAIVLLGILGGWFSKTTTDKLKEVFENLFVTKEDEKREDSLAENEKDSPGKPTDTLPATDILPATDTLPSGPQE